MVRTPTRNKGRPCDLRRTRAHPGPRVPLPVGIDFVAEYERAHNVVLPREPEWAAARDPLHAQPVRQAARASAIMALWGSVEECWTDIVHNTGRARFIPSYLLYLRFR
jgi:hypothetical protein